MKKQFQWLCLVVMTLMACNVFAITLKPGFVVTPFAKSATLALNSSLNVLIVAQNGTGANQTITNIVPQIPNNSGITATILNSNCHLLAPGASCGALIKLQSSNKPGSGNLNISICAFNGAFCSRITKPFDYSNTQPVAILVEPATPTIAAGTTKQFYAIALLANSTIQNVTDSVTWSSSNKDIAVISNASDSKGLARGITGGASTITATLSGVSGSSTLGVTTATLSSIIVTPVNSSIANGSFQQFTATGIFSDNSHQDLSSQVIWASSNQAVAVISNNSGNKGLASSKSAGTTTISASFGAITGTTNLQVTAAVLTSISVTPTNPFATVYTTQGFTATGIYSDNTTKDITKEVTWSTQSTLVAIISNQPTNKGTALGVGVGATNVFATFGGVTGSTIMTVIPAVLKSINIDPTNQTLPVGAEQNFVATGIYDNGRTQDITTSVTWTSSNTNIATISNAPETEGLAKGIRAGTVSIAATLDGVRDATALTVAAPTLVSIAVTPANPTIANGGTQQFTAIGTYSDTSTLDLTQQATWVSSSPAVAIISNAVGSEGLASTVSPGATSISAVFNGITGSTTLTVSAAALVSITVTPSSPSIVRGTTIQMTATGTYSDLSTKNITNESTWTSSNANVTVSNAVNTKGLVTGVNAGSSTVSAIKGVVGSTTVSVVSLSIGSNYGGGKVACLDGGLNNLVTANTNNSNGLTWGGNGTVTNAQSDVNGQANTTKIVNVLGAGTSYGAGLCSAYEIDSAGNTPCQIGNICYNDWFLPSINQLSCMRNNRNQVGGFSRTEYWSSTEVSSSPSTQAMYITFENSGFPPAAASKAEAYAVRCVRVISNVP